MNLRLLAVAVSMTGAAGGAVWYLQQQDTGTPAPPAAALVQRADPLPAGCDPLVKLSVLPATLVPSAPTIEAIVQALDAALGTDQKDYLRCAVDADELIGRVHHGFGRWLRNTLHLWSDNPLTTNLLRLGVKSADSASSVITRVYFRHLHGQPLAIDEEVAAARADGRRGGSS